MDYKQYLKTRREIFTLQDSNKETDNLLWACNSLGGEVGEFENLVKKVFRDHHGQITTEILNKMISELGDQFWYLVFVFEILEEDPIKLFNDKDFNQPHIKDNNLLIISNSMGAKVGAFQDVVDLIYSNNDGIVSKQTKVILLAKLVTFFQGWINVCANLEIPPFEIISTNIDKLKDRYDIK